MGTVSSLPCRLALLWSGVSLIVSALSIWGLLMLSQYRITALEQLGLEPYQAEGKSSLLTPAGQRIVHAGKVAQRDAWEVVRR